MLLFFISLKLSEDTASGTKGPFLRNTCVLIVPVMHLGSSIKLKLIRTDAWEYSGYLVSLRSANKLKVSTWNSSSLKFWFINFNKLSAEMSELFEMASFAFLAIYKKLNSWLCSFETSANSSKETSVFSKICESIEFISLTSLWEPMIW